MKNSLIKNKVITGSHTRKLAQSLVFIFPLLAGCSALLAKPQIQTTYYTLEPVASVASKAQADLKINTNTKLPTLIISTPKAAAGFDTQRMMYTRTPYRLEQFAQNAWVDTPARMLQPLMVKAIEKTAGFNAVLPKHSLVKSELRLESEIVRLIQIFNTKPSQVQFTLRATMIDNTTGQVIAHREFDEQMDATSDNPMAGAVAANQVVNTVLEKLSTFSHVAAMRWQDSVSKTP